MQFDDDVRNFTRNYTDHGATFLISLAGAKSSTEITIKFEGAIRQLLPGPSVCVTSVLISDNSEMEIALIQGDFEPGQMKSVLVTPEDNYLDVIFEISVPFCIECSPDLFKTVHWVSLTKSSALH